MTHLISKNVSGKRTGELRPIIKWAGGKGQLLPEIRKRYPVGLGTRFVKYAEPFLGGGAVLLDILTSFQMEEIFVSDINEELTNLYTILRDDVESLIHSLQEYKKLFLPMDVTARKAYYYEQRACYNERHRMSAAGVEMAALFVFLNKTCFNGLYRVNGKGDYNVPMGGYREPQICDEDNLRFVSQALSNTRIVHGDYRASSDFIDERTFAYFDPPYRPLTHSSSFTAYTQDGFDDDEQERLAEYVCSLDGKGSAVLVSNSDPKNIDPNDDFFERLYAPLTIDRILASRNINSKGNKRGKISELLIHNEK